MRSKEEAQQLANVLRKVYGLESHVTTILDISFVGIYYEDRCFLTIESAKEFDDFRHVAHLVSSVDDRIQEVLWMRKEQQITP